MLDYEKKKRTLNYIHNISSQRKKTGRKLIEMLTMVSKEK